MTTKIKVFDFTADIKNQDDRRKHIGCFTMASSDY